MPTGEEGLKIKDTFIRDKFTNWVDVISGGFCIGHGGDYFIFLFASICVSVWFVLVKFLCAAYFCRTKILMGLSHIWPRPIYYSLVQFILLVLSRVKSSHVLILAFLVSASYSVFDKCS